MKKEILKRLKEIEKEKEVTILFAVESGSREWGFASEDSDYDIRCVHAGRRDNYLGLKGVPEQIDSIKGTIDVVSWDIKKFFSLFLKSNPTVSEWLSSKRVYVDKKFGKKSREDLFKIFSEDFSRSRLKHHYLSLAKQNYEKYINSGEKEVLLKKYVYILRALGCVEYISKNNSLPPLNWKLSSVYLPKNIKTHFEKLVELKKKSEKNKNKRIEELDKWIENKLKELVNEDKHKFDESLINAIVVDSINYYSQER